jgi:hypothetical protein
MRTLSTVKSNAADARQDALEWLRSQLRWEQILGDLRSTDESPAKQAA